MWYSHNSVDFHWKCDSKFEVMNYVLLLMVYRLVWKIACLVPTVHIVGDYYRPKNRCPMNVLINVCKEARALVLSLQPSYFINNTVVEGFTYGDRTTSMLRNYFTPALDTIWLVRQDKERLVEDLSFYTSWFCGTCEVLQPSTSHGKDIEGNDCLRKSEDIRRLAINIKAWNNPDNFHGWGDMGSAGIISQHCVEEVLLVVETFGDFHWEDIVHFVEPSVLHRIAILKKNRLWDLPYLGKAYGDGVEVSRSRAVGETRNWEEDAMRMSAALEYHKHSFMDGEFVYLLPWRVFDKG